MVVEDVVLVEQALVGLAVTQEQRAETSFRTSMAPPNPHAPMIQFAAAP